MNIDMNTVSAKQTQKTISQIGAKIADAVEALHPEPLSAKPILIKVQLELEELYLSLEPEHLPQRRME